MNHIDRSVILLADGFEDVAYKTGSEKQMSVLREAVRELTAERRQHYMFSTEGEIRLLVSKDYAQKLRSRLAEFIDDKS